MTILFHEKPGMNAEDLLNVREINEVLQRLAERRVTEILVEGLFAQSMLAWKIASYQQSLLYRVVSLTSGCALCVNGGNSLCSILSARAIIETVAIASDFEQQVLSGLEREDLKALDTIAMTLTFATRHEDWLKEHPEHRAVNILTLVKKLERRFSLKELFRFYEIASEFCHPNYAGHHQFFAHLDQVTGTVNFSETKDHAEKLHLILGATLLLGLYERGLDRIDEALPKIADLQHQLNPVQRSQ